MAVTVGIDIGSEQLKVVALRTGGSFEILGAATAPVPAGSWQADTLQHKEEIAKAIKDSFIAAKPRSIHTRQAVIGLPESVIYSGSFSLPMLSKKEFDQAAPFAIAEKLSINVEEYQIDYESTPTVCQPLPQPVPPKQAADAVRQPVKHPELKTTAPTGPETTVFAIAAKKTLIDSVIELAKLADLDLIAIDCLPAAAVRSALPNDRKIRLLVDLGAAGSGLSVAEGRSLRLTSAVPGGIGSIKNDQETTPTKLADILGPVFDEMVHVNKFFENRLCPGQSIEQVVLTGGGTTIPGVVEAFQKQTRLPVTLTEPGHLLSGGTPFNNELARVFGGAIGLAMREV